MKDVKFEITEDGSHTLFVPDLREHYHSTHGALQESMHVYIEAALRQCKKTEINVLEVGFGTGLNAFLSFLESEKNDKTIHYTALELYPISFENAKKLNYASQINKAKKSDFLLLHQTPWNERVAINTQFSLLKLRRNAEDEKSFVFAENFDVIFFDAFAPDKQPQMWTQAIFNALFLKCNPSAILSTYCAKGEVRRMLQKANFRVERLPGPPGKREILRALRDPEIQ